MTATEAYKMRAPCPDCGNELGAVREVNGQDTVRCIGCGRHCYNAPRTETGRAARSVSTVHNGIKPKQRIRILGRASARCEVCGGRDNLHVGHIVSVAVGLEFGLDETMLNDDENLLCMCAECNLGLGDEPMPLRVAATVLRARISWAKREQRAG